MSRRNEITYQHRSLLMQNLDGEGPSPYSLFQIYPMIMTREVYNELSKNLNCHIRVYFALDVYGSYNPTKALSSGVGSELNTKKADFAARLSADSRLSTIVEQMTSKIAEKRGISLSTKAVSAGAPTIYPRMIAVPAYKLDEIDSSSHNKVWDPIFRDTKIFELIDGAPHTAEVAKMWIENWAYAAGELDNFTASFTFPRPNFVEIFENEDSNYALLELGMRKDMAIMSRACTSTGVPLSDAYIGDHACPCPPFCNDGTNW